MQNKSSLVTTAMLLTAVLSGCTQVSPPPLVDAITGIEVSTGELEPAFQPARAAYEISSLHTRGDIRIRIRSQEAGWVLLNGLVKPTNEWVSFQVNAIRPDAFIRVQAGGDSASPVTYQIATQPADFPALKVMAKNPVKGDVLLATRPAATNRSAANYLLMLDELGRPQYYKRTASAVNAFQAFIGSDGKRRYAYHEAPVGDFSAMRMHLLDDSFQLIRSFQLLPALGRPAFPADVHEFVYIDDNHVVVVGYYPKKVTNMPGKEGQTVNVLASIIQEQKDGQVVFDWDSTDHPELYGMSVESQKFQYNGENYQDYAHVNSVVFSPADGHFVASFRNLDAVLKINRLDGTVMWTLGGPGDRFGLTAEQKFSRPHHATFLSPTRLLLFDNGNTAGRTRILELELQQEQTKITDFLAVVPRQQRLSPFMGSVQKVAPSRYFIGWGGHPNYLALPNVTEIDAATGEEHFALTLPEGVWSYRAQKVIDNSASP